MENDDEFQIVTTPLCDEPVEVEIHKKPKKASKRKIAKISKPEEIIENEKELSIQHKMNDEVNDNGIGKRFDFLDITKVLSDQEKAKTTKSFSVLSKGKSILPGILNYMRCRDGNADFRGLKYISFAICHPLKQCMVVGSNEGSVCMFKVDGDSNKAVCKPFFFENFPIRGACLIPSSHKVVLFSKNHYLKIFHLTTSEITDHPIEKHTNIVQVEASPRGDLFVVATRDKLVYVFSVMGLDVIYHIQVSGKPRSVAFSHEGRYLYVFEDTGKVSVFEFLEKGRPVFVRRWVDEGCVDASCIAVSPDNRYVACGSPGFVNVYALNDCWQVKCPVPLYSRSYKNMGVTCLAFNRSSELLAIGLADVSNRWKGACKLLHLQSMSIFSNFPPSGPASTARATSLSFSPNDKYLAVGQQTGVVALYSMNHYNKY